jgi:hypothetical protein
VGKLLVLPDCYRRKPVWVFFFLFFAAASHGRAAIFNETKCIAGERAPWETLPHMPATRKETNEAAETYGDPGRLSRTSRFGGMLVHNAFSSEAFRGGTVEGTAID